ncbi:MAG: S-layer homology domain-containing protein [Bacillota bacterium]|nr:S-layer homology domain-containing protein [Bacillota bacterium]
MKRNKLLLLTAVLCFLVIFSCGALADTVPSNNVALGEKQGDTRYTVSNPYKFTDSGQDLTAKDSWLAHPTRLYYVDVPVGTTSVYFAAIEGSDFYGGEILPVDNVGQDNEKVLEDDGIFHKVYGTLPISTVSNRYYYFDNNDSAPLFIIQFREVNDPTVTAIDTKLISNYEGNKISCPVGATFEDAAADAAVKLYITAKENGTSEEAETGTLVETTAGEMKSLWNQTNAKEVPLGSLKAGNYWLGVEVGESRMYEPVTVYATAKEYAQAALDNVVEWYGQTGFINAKGEYLGLSADTGNSTGIDWEAYIFGALGYTADSDLLVSTEGKTYLDMKAEQFKDMTQAELIANDGSAPASKVLGRQILGIAGIGGDPRNIGGKNLVEALISLAYVDNDIAGGELNLDEDGTLRVRLADNDTIAEGYFLLALEVVNATPEEGYTEELRAAGLKTIKKYWGSAGLDGTVPEGGFPWDSNSATSLSDYYSMSLYPLCFMNDVEGMEGEAEKMLANFVSQYKDVVDNGSTMNAFTTAVAVMALHTAGVTLDEFTGEAYTDANGRSELSNMLRWQLKDGSFGASVTTRMLTYQTLQVLVGMMNDESVFETVHDIYVKNYPQYDENVIAVQNAINSLPSAADITLTDKEKVEATREAYNALTEAQKSVIGEDALKKLTDAEAKIAELEKETPTPPKSDITIEDMKDITNPNAWYYKAVDWAIRQGFFEGDDKGNFNPNAPITRAEFSQMLYNYYKDDPAVMKDGEAKSFNDVSDGRWYYESVMACAKAGIFIGDDKGNFNPNEPISRQDAALVLMRIIIGQDAIDAVDVETRLAELKAQGYEFPDFNETSNYAKKAMAAAAGVVYFGNENKQLTPQNKITRAETAQVLYNYFNK